VRGECLATERSFDEILFGEPLEKITCSKLLQVLQSVQESPAIEFKTWIREAGKEIESMRRIIRALS
jgi:hypothetical protein